MPLEKYLRGLITFFDLPMSYNYAGPALQPAFVLANNIKTRVWICYEIAYSDLVAKESKNIDFLTTISNDTWFGRTIGPNQHLQIAQMRALESGKYLVRVANSGITAVISNKGVIEQQLPQFTATSLSASIPLLKGATPYSHWGSMPIILFCLFLLVIALIQCKISHQLD